MNSGFVRRTPTKFKPDIDVRACKYIWLGTHQKFDDAFTFIFEETEYGWIWVHAYQFDADTATFIVECSEETWRRAGFDRMNQDETISACEKIFARNLGGHRLMSNARHLAWFGLAEFQSHAVRKMVARKHRADRRCRRYRAFLGRFRHQTCHGERDRARRISAQRVRMSAAFRRYEDERRLEVLRLQNAARNSTEWFEDVERYFDLDPVQFNYSLLTRSQRISHENLRQRDRRGFRARRNGSSGRRQGGYQIRPRPPMFVPFRVRDLELARTALCVSPMAQYRAVDGTPDDWHFVHYGERAKGGAGLVFTEMTCVSPEGRITPGCTGLYAPEHERAWKRIVDFVHAETDAKIAIQLGHSGAKGSTQLGWEEMDAPLATGNWEVLAPSPVAWSPRQPGAARDDARRYGPGARRVRARGGDGSSASASTGSSCTTPTAT